MDRDRRSVRVACGCSTRAVLARVRAVNDGPRQVEYRLAIDADWVGDWRQHFGEAMAAVEAGTTWREFVEAGGRPSFDGWSVSCRRSSCDRIVEGHIDALVAFMRYALASGKGTVTLTSDALAAAAVLQ